MVKQLTKQSKELAGKFTDKGVIAYPRFYIKSVGGSYSIYHRLTHSYMDSFTTEQELKEGFRALAKLSEHELWEKLYSTRGFSVSNVVGVMRDRHFESEEDWYFGAWGAYTTRFFKDNPTLFQEVLEAPVEIINTVKRAKAEKQKTAHIARQEQIEKQEQEYKVKPPVATEPLAQAKKIIRKPVKKPAPAPAPKVEPKPEPKKPVIKPKVQPVVKPKVKPTKRNSRFPDINI